MLQLCAIYSVHDEIIEDLDKDVYSNEIIERVNQRLSSAAKLWDVDNFTYLTAKKFMKI